MSGVLYIIWLGLPFSLMILSGLYRCLEFLREDSERRISSFVWSIGKPCLIASLLTLSFHRWVLENRELIKLTPDSKQLATILLFPLALLLVFSVRLILRVASPQKQFSTLQRDLPGSGFGYFVVTIAIFAILASRPPDQNYFEVKSSSDSGSISTSDSSKEQVNVEKGGRAERGLEPRPIANSQTRSTWLSRLLAFVGFGDEDEAVDSIGVNLNLPYKLPDFNQEGFLKYAGLARSVAQENGVDPWLVQALVEIGSGYNDQYVADDGSTGLMHIQPSVGAKYGHRNLYSPQQNLMAGTQYLRDLIVQFNGEITTVISAFKAGPDIVAEDGSIESDPETDYFTKRVVSVYEILRSKASSQEALGK